MTGTSQVPVGGVGVRSLLRREWVAPFTLFMLLIVVDQVDYNAVGPITGLIRTEFGLTATEVGIYAGVGALFGLLSLIPTGELIKRVGFRAAGTITPLTVVTGGASPVQQGRTSTHGLASPRP